MICSRFRAAIVENRFSVSNCNLEQCENGLPQPQPQLIPTGKDSTDE